MGEHDGGDDRHRRGKLIERHIRPGCGQGYAVPMNRTRKTIMGNSALKLAFSDMKHAPRQISG